MPWRGPSEPGEFATLGYLVAEFIESSCVIPDGDNIGRPFILTDEQLRFLLWFYRIEADGSWRFQRGGQLVRPQKWGKGPLSAAIICAEAAGPVRFDGWDAHGEPVGRPWATPWIQVTAGAEDQTANVWRVLLPMIELGDLKADIPDTGDTRINVGTTGLIEYVTSKAGTRLGQRITFANQDQTEQWLESTGGRKLADTQRRNLAGTGGRFLETPNAWDPAEQSVAQQTNEDPLGVHADYPQPPAGNFKNAKARRRILKYVYGDSCRKPADKRWEPWISLDRIDIEARAIMKHDAAQAERYFGNRSQQGESLAFELADWKERAEPGLKIPNGELVVVGVDGARFQDSLAMVATDVVTGHVWPLGIWERPANADDDYEHPADEIDGTLLEAFDTWHVWRCYIDPQYIDHLRDRWTGRWGDKIIDWYTNRPKQIGFAVRHFKQSIGGKDLTHDGDTVLTKHIAQSRKKLLTAKDDDGKPLHSIQKERPGSPMKVDGAMAAVLSWEARGDAIAAGAKKKRSRKAVFF